MYFIYFFKAVQGLGNNIFPRGLGRTVDISAGWRLRAAADERPARQRRRPQTQLGGLLRTHQRALDKRGGFYLYKRRKGGCALQWDDIGI